MKTTVAAACSLMGMGREEETWRQSRTLGVLSNGPLKILSTSGQCQLQYSRGYIFKRHFRSVIYTTGCVRLDLVGERSEVPDDYSISS